MISSDGGSIGLRQRSDSFSIVVGLCVPARARFSRQELVARARGLLADADQDDEQAAEEALTTLRHAIEECEAPVRRLEHALHPLVAFVILPLFALANAGVSVRGIGWADLVAPTTVGIALGLFLGKQVGVLFASWIAVRAGIAALPEGVTWRHIHGAGVLAGIGFTMALFVAGLAYTDPDLHRQAKVGVLVASLLAAVIGAALLRRATPGAPARGVS